MEGLKRILFYIIIIPTLPKAFSLLISSLKKKHIFRSCIIQYSSTVTQFATYLDVIYPIEQYSRYTFQEFNSKTGSLSITVLIFF